MPCRPFRFAPLLALFALAFPRPAQADWPMARHDPARTAAMPGQSDIQTPAVYWSFYLGGAIRRDALFPYDIDHDGQAEFIYATGGAVAAKRADDTQLWRTRTYGEGNLLGLADLDADGADELILYTTRRVFVLDPATGSVRWSQPEGEMGHIAYVRIGDVQSSKAPDLVITECTGCGAGKVQTGFIYSFARGFSAPKRVPLPVIQGVASGVTLVNVDGQGPAKILLNKTSSTFALLDGETGSVLATSPSVGENMAWLVTCLPGDIDGAPGEEVVCVSATSPEPVPTAADLRKVFALKANPGSQGGLDLLWVYAVPADQGLSSIYNEPLLKLTQGGARQVAVTGRRADGSYAMHLLAAATGAEIASLEGQRYVGAAHLDGDADPTLFTQSDTTLRAWSFDGEAQALVPRWALEGRYPISEPPWARLQISSAASFQPLILRPDAGGPTTLLTASTEGAELDAYTTAGPAPTLAGALPFDGENAVPTAWSVAGRGLAIAGRDGTLRFRDDKLQANPGALRFGGYYADGGWQHLGHSPVVASLDGGAASIIVEDSRGSLVRLNAASAGPDKAPLKVWEIEQASSPIILPGLAPGGAAGIVAIKRKAGAFPAQHSLRALRADSGAVLWETPLGTSPANDLVPGDFDGDAIPDIALQSAQPEDSKIVTRAFSGQSGGELWSFAVQPGLCGFQPAGFSVGDWDGDGFDDVLQQAYFTRVDSGKTGDPLIISAATACYFMPALSDLDGDGLDEVLLTAGQGSLTVLSHDLETLLFHSTEEDRPYPYSATARCDAGPVLLQGSWATPARLKLTRFGARAFGASTSLILADGQKYPDQATAEAKGVGSGQLTSPVVHTNLRGDGRPVAVIGSTDGWLYLVDPCTEDLHAALDFGFSVGDVVFGDTDGDGLDEILVSVADGNLYDVRNALPVPGTGGNGPGGGGPGGAGGAGGAGGEGGAGGASAASGQGGAGGAGGGKHPRRPLYPLYGRADCYCQGPAPAAGSSGAWLFLAVGIAAARRSRQKRP